MNVIEIDRPGFDGRTRQVYRQCVPAFLKKRSPVRSTSWRDPSGRSGTSWRAQFDASSDVPWGRPRHRRQQSSPKPALPRVRTNALVREDRGVRDEAGGSDDVAQTHASWDRWPAHPGAGAHPRTRSHSRHGVSTRVRPTLAGQPAQAERRQNPTKAKAAPEGGLFVVAPGSDLLSHGLSHTTIGAGAFHCRVRDGIGWDHAAVSAREAELASRTIARTLA